MNREESLKLNVAALSTVNQLGDLNANIQTHEKWAEEAANKGADLVLFPELSLTGYGDFKFVKEIAQEVPGPATEHLEGVARRLGLTIGAGIAERSEKGCHICHFVVSPRGYEGKYRKVHLAGSEEKSAFLPGEEWTVLELDGYSLGILICFDGRFAEAARIMGIKGCDVILHPHGNFRGALGYDQRSWTDNKLKYLFARSMDAESYWICCNSAGTVPSKEKGEVVFPGGGIILAPDGGILAKTERESNSPSMAIAEIEIPSTAKKGWLKEQASGNVFPHFG